ncbi:MAG: IS110 family transposase, partial [Thiohalomonadaceae bacterium]
MRPQCGLLQLTSARFLAEVGDVKRYRNAWQVAAYIGVTPARDESGDKIRKTVMAKLGNARLRKDLYMPAIV